jgi:phospholipid/cholesterol/gamma-HCH transport system substrate-binding protein
MSNSTHTVSVKTSMKVGIFTALGLGLIVLVTVLINDKPFWWRACQLVHITVEDATGLKVRSPVRSRGIQVGYLHSVGLSDKDVRLGICLTAPVEVLPDTRAYLKGEGFLGDKFVELKPLKYTGRDVIIKSSLDRVLELVVPTAYAEEEPQTRANAKDIPMGSGNSQDMQAVVGRVDSLVNELTSLTKQIQDGINPKDLRNTLQKLNITLENASKTLSPEGGLTMTAQRTLSKLEDAIEQMRDMMTRVNQGKGSVGMMLNDPSYAEEIKEAIRNVNKLLSRVGSMRLIVDLGTERIPVYEDARGWFQLGIWPTRDRYYLVGITFDPRGKLTSNTTTTTTGSVSTTTQTTTVERGATLLTAMLGKVIRRRLDLSAGVLHGDGAVGVAVLLGPEDEEERFRISLGGYTRQVGANSGAQVNYRSALQWAPLGGPYLKTLYLRAGVDSFSKINGKLAYAFGAGLSFDDNDIKVLFSFR